MDGRPLAGYVGANHGSSFRDLAERHRTQLDTSMHYGPVELVSRNYTPNSKDDLVEITLLERFRIVKILLMILLNDPYHFFPHRQTKVWPPRGPRGAGDR